MLAENPIGGGQNDQQKIILPGNGKVSFTQPGTGTVPGSYSPSATDSHLSEEDLDSLLETDAGYDSPPELPPLELPSYTPTPPTSHPTPEPVQATASAPTNPETEPAKTTTLPLTPTVSTETTPEAPPTSQPGPATLASPVPAQEPAGPRNQVAPNPANSPSSKTSLGEKAHIIKAGMGGPAGIAQDAVEHPELYGRAARENLANIEKNPAFKQSITGRALDKFRNARDQKAPGRGQDPVDKQNKLAPNPTNKQFGIDGIKDRLSKQKGDKTPTLNPKAEAKKQIKDKANKAIDGAITKAGAALGGGVPGALAAKALTGLKNMKPEQRKALLVGVFIIIFMGSFSLLAVVASLLGGFGNTPSDVASSAGPGGEIIVSDTCKAVSIIEATVYNPLDEGVDPTLQGSGKSTASGEPLHIFQDYLLGAYKNSKEGNYVTIASDLHQYNPNAYPRDKPLNAYIPKLEAAFNQPITFRINDTGSDFGSNSPPPYKYKRAKEPLRRSPSLFPGATPEKFIDLAIRNYKKEGARILSAMQNLVMYVEYEPGGCVRKNSSIGGVGVSQSGFAFPLKTTKKTISNPVGSSEGWCYKSETSCHHDYAAADIFAPTGTTVLAAKQGTVIRAADRDDSRVGSRVTIRGEDNNIYYYAHLGDGTITVKKDDKVAAGQPIGQIGTRSDAAGTDPHLHFNILPPEYTGMPSCSGASCSQYRFIDPQPYLIKAFEALPN